MTFKEMKFKGKRVFVDCDGAGKVKTEGGRAFMKYQLDDERVYRPYPQNLGEPTASAARQGSPSGDAEESVQRPSPNRAPKGAIIAYTDGACLGNPGPAGLGYTLTFPDGRKIARGEPLGQATNNVAELTAIRRVLEHLEEPSQAIVIHTDSEYSIGVLVRGWNAKANRELILSIRKLLSRFPGVEIRKVKGHAGIPENELVDELARTAAETQTVVQ